MNESKLNFVYTCHIVMIPPNDKKMKLFLSISSDDYWLEFAIIQTGNLVTEYIKPVRENR